MISILLTGGIILVMFLGLGLALRLELVIRRYRYYPTSSPTELPTVSVCVPARNETHAMTACLERILASDYQRLETIVLDDSSVDNTSVLIKSFAHAGVRFVEGDPLEAGWLGKNHALQALLEEASGSYILYLDVDTSIQPDTISRLVSLALEKKTSLLSVLPQREDSLRASVFFGTLRYFWTLISPAPVSSSCLLIDRKRLLEIGGFSQVAHHVQPETALAVRLRTEGLVTRFLISSSSLGVSHEKKWTSQIETSTRLLQPMFGHWAGLIAILLTCYALLPVAGVIGGLLSHNTLLFFSALIALAVVAIAPLKYYHVMWRRLWWLGVFLWPYAVLQEAVVVVMSIVGYARGTVTWKGRPIERAS